MADINLGVVPVALQTTVVLTAGENTYTIRPVSLRVQIKPFYEAQPLRTASTGDRVRPLIGSASIEWEIEYMGAALPSGATGMSIPALNYTSADIAIVGIEILGRARDTYRVRLTLREAL